MLNSLQLRRAVDMQQRSYRLLKWLPRGNPKKLANDE
jgi:hypothetical protein